MIPLRGLVMAAVVMIAAPSPAAMGAPKMKSPADLAALTEYALDNSPMLKSLSAKAEAAPAGPKPRGETDPVAGAPSLFA